MNIDFLACCARRRLTAVSGSIVIFIAVATNTVFEVRAADADSAAVPGISAGATLGLLTIRAEDVEDPGSAKRFILHIPIRARPQADVKPADLTIHVLFYDRLDSEKVVSTIAKVNSRWASLPADWNDGNVEELIVEYQLPKTTAPEASLEDRSYYGYIVRIFYKEKLQAAYIEPEDLPKQIHP